MPHLLTEYSKNLDVQPSDIVVNKHFYPVLPEDYVVIYNEQGINSKCYNYYGLVCDLLKQQLNSLGISIVGLGSQENMPSRFDYLYPDLNFRNNAYIVSKAKLVISVDNAITQYASSQRIPVITLYGNIYPSITTPYWSNKNTKIDLEPNWDKKPCMSLDDPDQSIDKIKAEEVAESCLKLLSLNYKNYKNKIPQKINFKTKLINKNKAFCVDVIPTNYVPLPILNNQIINLRLDKDVVDSNAFKNYCSNHLCSLYLKDSVMQLDFIKAFSNNIKSINIILTKKIETIPKKYFSILKSLNIDFRFLVTDENILNDVRLEYFDQEVLFYNTNKKMPKDLNENHYFFSFKSVVEGDKIYNSTYHWKNNIDNKDNIVDNPDYLEELDYFYIYEQQRS